MDEGDLEAEEPAPRTLVDELDAAGGEPLELITDVGDLEGDVVHARPALGEELADRRVGAERGEELDPAFADSKRCCLDTLVGDGLAMLELGTEEPFVGLDGRVQVGDGDTDVVDPPGSGHESDATGRSA